MTPSISLRLPQGDHR